MQSLRRVLFLCTGNYYRSRFAEELFNHLAIQHGLPWRADSRGLAIERGEGVNFGPMSANTLDALQARGITPLQPQRMPAQATWEDFHESHCVVALKEKEHRPLMEDRFPDWQNKILYWHVDDVDVASAAEAIALMEAEVKALVEAFIGESVDRASRT